MTGAVRKGQSMRFCGRSYMAFLFTPELPLENWLADLDSALERSPGFFVGRPVVLDLSSLQMSSADIVALIGFDLPPLLRGGRAASTVEMLQSSQQKNAEPEAEPAPPPVAEVPAVKPQNSSLMLQDPVRS